MEQILALLVLPTFWIIASKFIFNNEISFKEILIQFGITLFFIVGAYTISKATLTSDTEILNGQVMSKDKDRVSCSHSYSCNCSTDSKGNTSCDTCYEHSFDYDWNVHTNVGDLTIDRINRQGTKEPPRWTSVQIGEPVALEHSFKNYIKGAPMSIFNQENGTSNTKFQLMIPTYPRVYDYYKINRIISIGVPLVNSNLLNDKLADSLKVLGPTKQSNILLVFVKTDDQSYRYVLERSWLGGKKNDIIIVIGVTDYPKISWVDTITLGKNANNTMLQVKLRDDLMALQTIDNYDNIINIINADVKSNFNRKHMKDYAYLDNEIQPSMTAMIIIFVLTLLCNIGLSIFFFKNEV